MLFLECFYIINAKKVSRKFEIQNYSGIDRFTLFYSRFPVIYIRNLSSYVIINLQRITESKRLNAGYNGMPRRINKYLIKHIEIIHVVG